MAHVTVPNQNARIAYTAAAGQTLFPVPFPFFGASDLLVYSGGILATSGYGVTGAVVDGGFSSGQVAFGVAPGAGVQVVIRRRVAPVRATDFPYPSRILDLQALNTDLDRQAAATADVKAEVQQALRAPGLEGDMAVLPAAAERASRLLGFDASGSPLLYDPALLGGGGGEVPWIVPPGSVALDQLAADLATRIDLLDGSESIPGSVNARIAIEKAARENAVIALTGQIEGFETQVTGVQETAGDALSLAQSVQAVNATQATQITTAQTQAGNALALAQTVNTAQTGLAAQVATVSTKSDDAFALAQQAKTAADGAAQQVSLTQVEVDETKSLVADIQTAQAGLATSLSTAIVETAEAKAIAQEAKTATEGLASAVTTVQTQANGTAASVQQLLLTEDARKASYSLKTDVNGNVVGFGITNDGTVQGSGIVFRTDRFRIVAPSEGADAASVFETVGGVTYIRSTIIGEGRIGADNLAANAATELTGARDLAEYMPGGLAVTCLVFGFAMPRAGTALISYTAQVDQPQFNPDGSILSQGWRTEIFLNGISLSAAEGAYRGPCAMNAFQALPGGFHTLTVTFYGVDTCKIKGQSISALARWR